MRYSLKERRLQITTTTTKKQQEQRAHTRHLYVVRHGTQTGKRCTCTVESRMYVYRLLFLFESTKPKPRTVEESDVYIYTVTFSFSTARTYRLPNRSENENKKGACITQRLRCSCVVSSSILFRPAVSSIDQSSPQTLS